MSRVLVARLRGAAVAIALLHPLVVGATGPLDRPPNEGGFTHSLGLPSQNKPFAGFELQSYATGEDGELGGLINLGVDRDLGNPIVGAGALGLELYGGYRGRDVDGGGRLSFRVPSLSFGSGVDYNLTDDSFDLVLRLDLTGRRGGIFGGGSTIALRYLPTRDHTFSVGISKPLWGRHLGRSRAARDHVEMDDRRPGRLQRTEAHLSGKLDDELAALRDHVRWVTRVVMPFAERRGGDPRAAMEPAAEMAAHLQTRSALDVIRTYHASLERAFALALSGGVEPGNTLQASARRVSRVARRVLLEEVLLPYDRLLGQRKSPDSIHGFVTVAQSRFGRVVLESQDLAPDDARAAWFVFQTLCDHIEAERADQARRWEDSRFVWLPLQLALMPEEHDTQDEIDALIERAAGETFTEGNRIWYVVNESFQWEMARSVRLAENYHVLWIHDYRGVDGDGEPDTVALGQTLNYLETMAERVRRYDETGHFPLYLVVIDQHFFEVNDGRRFLRLLERPLEHDVDLPEEYADWEQRLSRAQQDLREAVDASTLLQLERSQYGDAWLEDTVRVHVNVTNQADPSFYSLNVAGIVPVPDNNMRDHRKIVFYDVTEEDPHRGVAMFTGMGIGEHYAGANWEDRALILKGPGALAVKTAARDLLRTQGFTPEQIPWALRPEAPASEGDATATSDPAPRVPDWLEGERGRVLQQHSETGFFDKPVEVTRAILYTLMPAGTVIQAPDSLWQNYLYASMLAGSALRGVRVLVISPALDHAPAGGAANMARAHDLMARLIVFRERLQDVIDDAGGHLGVGLYAPRQNVGDLAGRMRQAIASRAQASSKIPTADLDPDLLAARVDSTLGAIGYENPYADVDDDGQKPKLHLKANFFASAAAWEALMRAPELGELLVGHVGFVAEQSMLEHRRITGELPDVRDAPERLRETWTHMVRRIVSESDDLDPYFFYLTVGSVNLDYRSMVLNAEVMVTVSGWQSLSGFVDFLILPGLCEWVDTTEELDALLPAPSMARRWVSNFLRILL